jgi:hypothetical protein
MSVFSRKPKVVSGDSRYSKLYQVDDDYLTSRIGAGEFKNFGEAMRHYVMLGVRVEKQTEAGKDETLFAVVKKQQDVVREGMKPLVASVEHFGEQMQRHGEDISGLREDVLARLLRLEEQAERQASATSRLLEITVICYGILRHYVLGLFVVRLTKTTFSQYAEGFISRLEIFRASLRSGNLLLEGDYEKKADEFARSLAEATGVAMPTSDAEQSAAHRAEAPVRGAGALDVPATFPSN